jgi:hypothetical protein
LPLQPSIFFSISPVNDNNNNNSKNDDDDDVVNSGELFFLPIIN